MQTTLLDFYAAYNLYSVRVICYKILHKSMIWFLMAYCKAKFDNLPTAFLNKLKAAVLENDDEKRKTLH